MLSGSASAKAISGIKFMFQKTLDTVFKVFGIVKNPRGKKLPVILTREEVCSVLTKVRVLRHRACLTLIYSCGLRLHEATNIAPADIDSKRMMVHIKAGKGCKDRHLAGSITKNLPQQSERALFYSVQSIFRCIEIAGQR